MGTESVGSVCEKMLKQFSKLNLDTYNFSSVFAILGNESRKSQFDTSLRMRELGVTNEELVFEAVAYQLLRRHAKNVEKIGVQHFQMSE